MADTNPQPREGSREYTCGNCGFVGNSHEMEVHMATEHYACSAEHCDVCGRYGV